MVLALRRQMLPLSGSEHTKPGWIQHKWNIPLLKTHLKRTFKRKLKEKTSLLSYTTGSLNSGASSWHQWISFSGIWDRVPYLWLHLYGLLTWDVMSRPLPSVAGWHFCCRKEVNWATLVVGEGLYTIPSTHRNKPGMRLCSSFVGCMSGEERHLICFCIQKESTYFPCSHSHFGFTYNSWQRFYSSHSTSGPTTTRNTLIFWVLFKLLFLSAFSSGIRLQQTGEWHTLTSNIDPLLFSFFPGSALISHWVCCLMGPGISSSQTAFSFEMCFLTVFAGFRTVLWLSRFTRLPSLANLTVMTIVAALRPLPLSQHADVIPISPHSCQVPLPHSIPHPWFALLFPTSQLLAENFLPPLK